MEYNEIYLNYIAAVAQVNHLSGTQMCAERILVHTSMRFMKNSAENKSQKFQLEMSYVMGL